MKRGTLDRIARRLEGLVYDAKAPDEALDRFGVLIDALAAPGAPTTVHDPARIVDVHIADSLAGLAAADLERAVAIADLGAGAGLPSLVLAAARPGMWVRPVESTQRKAEFIALTAERMGLANVEVIAQRAEEWREGAGSCDAVTARALAALPVLVEYAAPLLRDGGVLVAWKGAVDLDELAAGHAAAALTGLQAEAVLPVTPFPGAANHTLHVYRKVAATPERFPRRAGMAVKRPLTAKSLNQAPA